MGFLKDINKKSASDSLSNLLEKYHKSQRKNTDQLNALQAQIDVVNFHLNINHSNLSATNILDVKQQAITWGNEILDSKKMDLKTEQGLKKALLALQDIAQSDLSEDEKKVTEWLAQLKLLKGIPLKYIVPLHQLLPNESIRFFTIDQQWISNLINGALSIGNNQSETDIWHDNGRSDTLYKKANIHLHDVHLKNISSHLLNHFPQQARQQLMKQKWNALAEDNVTKEISGFIMRSDFVKKYAGVRINATDASGKTCPSLSSEIIGSDIKICLFEGLIHNVTFYENGDSLVYKMPEKNIYSRTNSAQGVLDILKLVETSEVKESANLAEKLLCGPETFTFELNAN